MMVFFGTDSIEFIEFYVLYWPFSSFGRTLYCLPVLMLSMAILKRLVGFFELPDDFIESHYFRLWQIVSHAF